MDYETKNNLTKAAVVCAVVLVFLGAIIYLFFSDEGNWIYNAEFDAYKEEYEYVKDYVLENCKGEEETILAVSSRGESYALYDIHLSKYYESEELSKALITISNESFSYKDSNFDVIRVHGDRVSFCIRNGAYALAYSPNEVPTWINGPDEEREIDTKKICDGWYHVTEVSR